MNDLKRLNGGVKLIKQILDKNRQTAQPWSRAKQQEFINKYKNIKSSRSTPK